MANRLEFGHNENGNHQQGAETGAAAARSEIGNRLPEMAQAISKVARRNHRGGQTWQRKQTSCRAWMN